MKIALGADHVGLQLKEQIITHINSLGHETLDQGTSSHEVVDYPVLARKVATQVAEGHCDRGIMIDGAGIGSAIVANKVPGVRATLAYDLSSARNSREHNDANVLTLGAGLIGPALARQIVETWLTAECSEERHRRRVALIGQIESEERERVRPAGRAVATTPISEEDLERVARRLEALLAPRGTGTAPQPVASPVSPSPAHPPQAPHAVRPGAAALSRTADPTLGPEAIARVIDHTLLRPDATGNEILRLCAEAREHGFAAVCVNPVWASLAARELQGSSVAVCCVVGFPLGAAHREVKALEARRAVREGAREIDMVLPIGALKAGDDDAVLRDIRAVVESCREGRARCKVILEAALLTDDEKRRACRLARRAGAHFVKTSTGFGPGGATVADVALMAAEVHGSGMGVKAAGGIRSYADALRLLEAGATRIGTSAGVAIVREAREAAAARATALAR